MGTANRRAIGGESEPIEKYKIFFPPIAIDLINNLLQVKLRKRYSVDKSLSHVYLQVTLHTCQEFTGINNLIKTFTVEISVYTVYIIYYIQYILYSIYFIYILDDSDAENSYQYPTQICFA